jgi:hypothetical protein
MASSLGAAYLNDVGEGPVRPHKAARDVSLVVGGVYAQKFNEM